MGHAWSDPNLGTGRSLLATSFELAGGSAPFTLSVEWANVLAPGSRTESRLILCSESTVLLSEILDGSSGSFLFVDTLPPGSYAVEVSATPELPTSGVAEASFDFELVIAPPEPRESATWMPVVSALALHDRAQRRKRQREVTREVEGRALASRRRD